MCVCFLGVNMFICFFVSVLIVFSVTVSICLIRFFFLVNCFMILGKVLLNFKVFDYVFMRVLILYVVVVMVIWSKDMYNFESFVKLELFRIVFRYFILNLFMFGFRICLNVLKNL